MTSTHRVTRVSPSLHSPLDDESEPLHITTTRHDVRSVAVSFSHSSLISAQLETRLDNSLAISLRLNELDPSEPDHLRTPLLARAVWNALFFYFAARDAVTGIIELPLPSQPLADALLSLGASIVSPSWIISRSAIFQSFHYSTASSLPVAYPDLPTMTGTVTHPARPLRPSTLRPIYSRYIPALESYFKMQLCTQNDLETIHSWMNTPRVDLYWEQKGTLADHERFIAERIDDRHLLSIIGSFVHVNGEGELKEAEPATYLELYWVKEDRLGALYDARDYDRGIHMLVGSSYHRGPHKVKAWLPSLVHYAFLDDSRTERVVAEPNSLNHKAIRYLESVGFVRTGEDIQFPHKTAALMILDRARFYELCPF